MKRGRQGERTDLKTDDDRQRNKLHASKGGEATKRNGTGRYWLTSERARALNARRWKHLSELEDAS